MNKLDYIKAANAYNETITTTKGSSKHISGEDEGGGGFGDMLSGAMSGLRDSLKRSEEVGKAAMASKASMVDLVTSVSEAELALQTITTVRDKVINAYMDIIKMQM